MNIPRDWSAETARSVITMLHMIADQIWDEYGDAIAFDRDLEQEVAHPRPEPVEEVRSEGFVDDEIPF